MSFMNGNSLTMTIVDSVVDEQVAFDFAEDVLKAVADRLKDEKT